MTFNQRQLIHIASETVVILAIVIYFSIKNRQMTNEMARLSHKIDAMGKILEAQGAILNQLAPREVAQAKQFLQSPVPPVLPVPPVPPVPPVVPVVPVEPPPAPRAICDHARLPHKPSTTDVELEVELEVPSDGNAMESTDLDQLLTEELGELKSIKQAS
jgi:hypothetical protein